MRGTVIILVLTLGAAFAQVQSGTQSGTYTGTYTGETAAGSLTLELSQQEDALTGVLSGPSIRFELEGFVYETEGLAAGAIYTAEGMAGFEAYLQGDLLGLYLFELDSENNPITASATEIIMTRQAATAPPLAADNPLGTAQANPLAPAAQADPLLGSFSDGSLTVGVGGQGGQYSGQIHFGGEVYTFRAEGAGATLSGAFTSAGQEFSFTATLEGDVLAFQTEGVTYQLQRQSTTSSGTTSPSSPGTTSPSMPLPAQPASGQVVVAQGSHASLTRDNARAFIEALEFSLEQVGYAYRFTDAEREQLLQAITQEFPRAQPSDQLVLSQAREIWTRTQSNWARATDAERREFLLGVFILAFGEQAVQQWVGPGGAGGQGQALGSGNCGSFEDCTSRFVDERTWNDTFNAQGCWAAAGCESYDSSTGTFNYTEDY